METKSNEVCCGCLSHGRKMKHVDNFWSRHTFSQVLTDILVTVSDTSSLYLCWECETYISNFIKFREQVKSCCKILEDFHAENHQLQTTSKLVQRSLPQISYTSGVEKVLPPNERDGTSNINELDEKEIKSEIDTYSDDDRSLFEIRNKERNEPIVQKRVKKEGKIAKTKKKKSQVFKENHQLQTTSKLVQRSLPQISYTSGVEKVLPPNERDGTSNINELDEKEIKSEIDTYSDDDRSLFEIRNKERNEPIVQKRVKKEGKIAKTKKKKSQVFKEIILSPEEVLKERVLMEQREEYVNSMFRCERCIAPFPNEDDLKDHVQTKHDLHGSKFTCAVCSRTFGSELSLAYHKRRHTLRWLCLLCVTHTSHTLRGARQHYRDKHTDSELYDLAAKAFQTYGGLQDVAETNGTKSDEQFPCEYCDKTFRWKTSLRKHMETHRIEAGHKRKPFCEPCNLTFTTTSNLRKHVKTSSKHQIQLKLRKLKEVPQDSPDPAQHAKDIENIKCNINSRRERFPCPQCDKKFQWKGNLLRHLQSHAARANGDLVCVPCNRTFSSIATYKQHMKISRKHVTENEFKYMCSECGKRFPNKIKLRDHIDWEHLKQYTHTCNHCQKVFKSHTSLYLHKQVVHKEYNAEHLCDHCGKSFPNKTKLRSHIVAIHTRDSPYKCDTCSARFSWHSCLSRHMRRVHRNTNNKCTVTT